MGICLLCPLWWLFMTDFWLWDQAPRLAGHQLHPLKHPRWRNPSDQSDALCISVLCLTRRKCTFHLQSNTKVRLPIEQISELETADLVVVSERAGWTSCSPARWCLWCQVCQAGTKTIWVLHTPASASLTGNPLMPLSPVRPACPCWK